MKIAVCIPSYDGKVDFELLGPLLECTLNKEFGVELYMQGCSFSTHTYNRLWVRALNARKDGVTHFCMLHTDVIPESGWLTKLVEVMKSKKADIVSAIIPLKDSTGFTSTGVDTPDPFVVRRITMTEAMNVPETFTHDGLVLNNGLMLCDISTGKPWIEKAIFELFNRIDIKDGVREAVGISEDWHFSREARKNGAVICATRAVKLKHLGKASFTNAYAWGDGTVNHENSFQP